jgi:hypothetical protein
MGLSKEQWDRIEELSKKRAGDPPGTGERDIAGDITEAVGLLLEEAASRRPASDE